MLNSTKGLLIFDLDGTVLDTIKDIHNALMITLEYFGFPSFDINITKSYVGDGIRKLVERAFGEKNFLPEHESFFRNIYREKITEHTQPFPNIIDILKDLKLRYHLVILSNKSYEMTNHLIYHFNLNLIFDKWFGGDSFIEKKPSPTPVKEICSMFNFNDDNIYIIGDNYTDVECGFNAGINSIYCTYGYGKLSHIPPNYTIKKPSELIDILG
ncbi:MAG: HAD-IA family hydrolase [Calditerrivibrio sp.]|nr:HAD-IA family hydrolase [Calditerrivibrio sp.]